MSPHASPVRPISPVTNPIQPNVMRVAHIDEQGYLCAANQVSPELPEGGALIQVSGCGFCGSDLDKVVNRKASTGTVLGHEVVGHIIALSSSAPKGWSIGQRIVVSHHVPCLQCHFCFQDSESMCPEFKASNFIPGGFAEVLALSRGHLNQTAFPVPDDISDVEASCVEPLACVLRAFRRDRNVSIVDASHLSKFDIPQSTAQSSFQYTRSRQSTLVVGLGFIGLLAAQTYGLAGDRVYGADVDANRLQGAKEHSCIADVFNPLEWDSSANKLPPDLPTPVDTVFLTAVNESSMRLAMACVRDGGRIVLFASPGAQGARAKAPDIDAAALYFREINLITSYSPALRDLRDSASMVFNRRISVAPLVSHRMPLEDIAIAAEAYRTGQARKVFIDIAASQKVAKATHP